RSISSVKMSARAAAESVLFSDSLQAGSCHVPSLLWHETSSIYLNPPNRLVLSGFRPGGGFRNAAVCNHSGAGYRGPHRSSGDRKDAGMPSAHRDLGTPLHYGDYHEYAHAHG